MSSELDQKLAEMMALFEAEAQKLRAQYKDKPQQQTELSQQSSQTLSQRTEGGHRSKLTRKRDDDDLDDRSRSRARRRPAPDNNELLEIQQRASNSFLSEHSDDEEVGQLTPRNRHIFHSAAVSSSDNNTTQRPAKPNSRAALAENLRRHSVSPNRKKPGPKKQANSNNNPDFRKELNRRMNISDTDPKIVERNKRDRRAFVLEECLKRGMDLRQNFSAYSYETKMYPAIKHIESIAPPNWGWDRSVVKDVIRTLCWDRVRSKNRRGKPSTDERKKISDSRRRTSDLRQNTQNIQNKSGKGKEPASTHAPNELAESESQLSDRESRPQLSKASKKTSKAPKTISRTPIPAVLARSSLRPVTYTKPPFSFTSPPKAPSSPLDTSSPTQHDAQLPPPLPPSSPEYERLGDIDLYTARVGNKVLQLARDLEYEEFYNSLGLTFGAGEMLCYRPTRGSKFDRAWKPLMFPVEYTAMIENYSVVGIQLKVYKEADYYNSDPETDSDSELYDKPNIPIGGQIKKVDGVERGSSRKLPIGTVDNRPASPPPTQVPFAQSKRNLPMASIPGDINNTAKPSTAKPRKTAAKDTTTVKRPRGRPKKDPANTKMQDPKKPAVRKRAPKKSSIKGIATTVGNDEKVDVETEVDVGKTGEKGAGDTEDKGAGDAEDKGAGDAEDKGAGDAEDKGVGDVEDKEKDVEDKEKDVGNMEKDIEADEEDMGGNEEQEGQENRRSSRPTTQSRRIRDKEEYLREVEHANDLRRARNQLKIDWNNFESQYPPGYIRYLPEREGDRNEL